jgi:hypothetical protein
MCAALPDEAAIPQTPDHRENSMRHHQDKATKQYRRHASAFAPQFGERFYLCFRANQVPFDRTRKYL